MIMIMRGLFEDEEIVTSSSSVLVHILHDDNNSNVVWFESNFYMYKLSVYMFIK